MFEGLKRLFKRRDVKPNVYKLYDEEEVRLLTMMSNMEKGTEAYKEAQSELRSLNATRAESRESKRRVSKDGKVTIAAKLIGLGGGIIGLFSIIKAERDGLTFTGEKRTIMDSICRGIGNILHRG